MKGLLVSVVLLVIILYGLIRPDQFSTILQSSKISEDYLSFIGWKNTKNL